MDALERDFYEERRRRWRRSAFWRGFFVAVALVIAGLVWLGSGAITGLERQVARFEVSGLIVDDPKRDALLQELADNDQVAALILRINSPGGTTAGSEALYASLRAVAEKKPVVAVLAELAASGGYVAAIAADHVIARGNTLTASIGVIMEYPDVTRVMEKVGVAMETVRSSALKGEPSPFRPTSPEARVLEQAMVMDSYGWFRGLVGERRGLDGAALDAVANGAVLTGRLALEKGLIDEIGGQPEAITWLESRDKALGDLPVLDWEVPRDKTLVDRIVGGSSASGGILGEISLGLAPKLYSIGP